MNNFERLAIAQAMMKQLSAAVKTGDPDNLRGICDSEMCEMAKAHNVSSVNVPINGKDAGIKMGIVPERTETQEKRVIADPKEFSSWCVRNAVDVLGYLVRTCPDAVLEAALRNEAGEVPGGTRVEEQTIVKRATTRLTGVKAAKIVEAYGSPQALGEALNQTLQLPGGE